MWSSSPSLPWKKPVWIFQLMCTRVGSGMQEYDFTPAARLICDVDKVLWPFPDQRQDAGAESWIIIILCVCVCVCIGGSSNITYYQFLWYCFKFISSVCKTVDVVCVFLRVCVSCLRAKFGFSARGSCFEWRASFWPGYRTFGELS